MSEILTTEQVEEILAGCEGVTPGPWETGVPGDYPPASQLDGDHTPVHSDTWGAFISVVTGIDRGDGRVGTSQQGKSNLAHIARLDPQTVSSLATELLALRKRVGELEGALRPFADSYTQLVGICWIAYTLPQEAYLTAIAALPTPKEPS